LKIETFAERDAAVRDIVENAIRAANAGCLIAGK
jgi:hypothetical protein